MDFFQIQYLINKYFFLFTTFNILTIFCIIYFYKNYKKIYYPGYFLIITSSLYTFFFKIIPNIKSSGWDRNAVCGWINLANNESQYNLYSVQSQNVASTFSEIPEFSAYYHPSLIFKFEILCELSPILFNSISLILVLFISITVGHYLENVNLISSLVLVSISFNTVYWLIVTGQFFQLELVTFTLGMLLLSKKYYKFSILLFFIFGIQKIYFLIIAFFLAIKYFRFKGFLSFTSMLAIINLIPIKILKDYFNFWFSDEGYLFGSRLGRHSFFNEKFGLYNSSLMTLFKDIFSFFNFNISNMALLMFYGVLTGILYLVFRRNTKFIKNYDKDFLNILFFILVFPLMKPYVYIYFSIVVVFLLNSLRNKHFEIFITFITSIGTIGILILEPYMFLTTSELSKNLIVQYKYFQYSNFYISWTVFLLLVIFFMKEQSEIE